MPPHSPDGDPDMPTMIHGGAYNLDNNRHDATVAAEVATLMRVEKLDFLAYQEGQEYADDLDRLDGARLFTTRGEGPSERDAGIVVREGVDARGYGLRRTNVKWPRDKGPGMHWPRSFPSVRVEGVRVVSVHMPRQHHALAYATCWTTLLLLALATRAPIVLIGDWNKSPRRAGPFTPRLLAKTIRGEIHGDGIDFAITRGVKVATWAHAGRRGSDHVPFLISFEAP